MLKTCLHYTSIRRSCDLWKEKREIEREGRQKSSPLRWCHCLICDSLEGGGGVTDISHPVLSVCMGALLLFTICFLAQTKWWEEKGRLDRPRFLHNEKAIISAIKTTISKIHELFETSQRARKLRLETLWSWRKACRWWWGWVGEEECLNSPSHRCCLLNSPPRRRGRRSN